MVNVQGVHWGGQVPKTYDILFGHYRFFLDGLYGVSQQVCSVGGKFD